MERNCEVLIERVVFDRFAGFLLRFFGQNTQGDEYNLAQSLELLCIFPVPVPDAFAGVPCFGGWYARPMFRLLI